MGPVAARKTAPMTRDRMAQMRALIDGAEKAVSERQDALTIAAADLARTIGPLATAHRLAELALEFGDLADIEGEA